VVLKLADEIAGGGGEPARREELLSGGRPGQEFNPGAEPGVVAGQPRRRFGPSGGKQQRLLVRCVAQHLRLGVPGQGRQFSARPAAA
jgi:hypothetical protein